MSNHRSLKSRSLRCSLIIVVLAIYSYPALMTTANTGNHSLPPISAPDLSLYLNLSKMKTTNSAEVQDPYYGVSVPVPRLGYLKFRLAFLLFRSLSGMLHGNLCWSLFLWNLFWWGLLCVLALWFFAEFLSIQTRELAFAGLAILMFLNLGILRSQSAAWTHLPSLSKFQDLELPYIRPFFPQLPIPLLILYLGLQMCALRKGGRGLWTAMGIVQLLAFAVFPYAMLMMAGITAVGAFGYFTSPGNRAQWRTLLIYAIACAICDALFFMRGGGIARTGAPGQYSLIHIQMSVLPHRIGGMWLMLTALTALLFFIRGSTSEVRWSLAGLGLSNLFLLSGDAFFSETALQVSHHGGYFVQLTATVLLLFAASAGSRYLVKWKAAWRLALGVITALLIVNGTLVAHATYQVFLPLNREEAELTRFLQSEPPESDDLVIAHAEVVDDDCGWVPLVSRSHVLFCRSAQVLLSPEQNRQLQRFRQAIYLYFTNKDGRWMEQILDNPNAVKELTRLMFVGQFTTDVTQRKRGEEAVRSDLLPLLARAEQHDPEVQAFFSHFRRVLVVDNADHPSFTSSRLAAYLKIEKQETFGDLLTLSCSSQTQ